ncbi:MAG: DUF454 family protein [Proteobacteria bacterium]|nr:DUF454 family protein [Pseudomonadota bacterium]
MSIAVKTLLIATSACCLVLGFVGLLVPLMPGFIFFAIAVICLATASPTLRVKLNAIPAVKLFLQDLDDQQDLALKPRLQAGVKSAARLLVGKQHDN